MEQVSNCLRAGFTVSFPLSAGDDFCGVRNTTFQAGEIITFKVYYTLGVYVAAGEATFRT